VAAETKRTKGNVGCVLDKPTSSEMAIDTEMKTSRKRFIDGVPVSPEEQRDTASKF
jgi:hypothetical protein